MKAIALISGGLDSALAARLIQNQGIEVIGLNFQIPFSADKTKVSGRCQNGVKEALSNLGIEIKNIDIKEEFLAIVKNPRYGLGANMNPCIDCKILMLGKARELMPQFAARFIISGEVLGQRPMSQHRQALELIKKKAGLEGFLLRPLSAKLLPETLPEKEGWVKRDKLFGFSGRSRRPQMELAKTLNLRDYPNPAGGCLLTDPQFAKRIKDLMDSKALTLDNIELLKIGRHFRLSADAKLVVGRNEEENNKLFKLTQENDYLFMPSGAAGPTTLGRGKFSDELIKLSCQITCRYCDLNGAMATDIIYKRVPEKEERVLKAAAIEESQLVRLRI